MLKVGAYDSFFNHPFVSIITMFTFVAVKEKQPAHEKQTSNF
jgi:hypothetical protein